MRGLPEYPVPSLEDCMQATLAAAKLTNPDAKFAGLSINTKALNDADAKQLLDKLEQTHQLPAVDPFRIGVDKLINPLLEYETTCRCT